MTTGQTTQRGLTIVRTLDASKQEVFDALSDAEALAQWWGPAGSEFTVLSFDFRRGGSFHYKLEGNGMTMWGRFVYGEIQRPDSIEFVSSFSDEEGNICKSPFPMDFPLEIFNRVTLEEHNGITTLTLTGHPINASSGQEATYQSIVPGMELGFGATFTQLESYLRNRSGAAS